MSSEVIVQRPPLETGASAIPGKTRWGALILLLAGTFVTVLDYFIANVAVPSIQSDLHTNPAEIQLVVAGYGVAFTAGLIAAGRMGDIFGRRRMFALGLAVFVLASLACGLAQSPRELVIARIVQGIGAAVLVPQVLAIIATLYTGAHRGRAFTAYGLVIGLAGVFGQIIGGGLISLDIAGTGWRAVFLLNVPIGLVALALIPSLLPRSQRVPGARLDLLGAVLMTAVLTLVVGCLVEGREQGWPEWSWLGLILAATLVPVTVAHLRRLSRASAQPLIEPGLFRSRNFNVGLTTTLVYFLAMGSFFFLLAFYLQQGRGLSALQSGLMFLALGAGYFGTSLLAAPLTTLLGRRLVALGPLTLAVGYVLVLVTVSRIGVSGDVGWLLPGLVVAGTGMGMTTGPLTNVVLTGVAPEHAASASGVVNTAQEGGAALGVAIAGTVFYWALGDASHASSYSHAIEVSLVPLIAFGALAAAIAWFLPRDMASVSDPLTPPAH